MMKIKKWMKDIFNPEDFNDINLAEVAEALNQSDLRQRWLLAVLTEIQRINMEVDKRLLHGPEYGITDLCARRKAIQDVLELSLSLKRQMQKQEGRPNPGIGMINLDRVTA